MREIGSEFWNIPISNKKNFNLPNTTKWFVSGRSALKYIIDDILSLKDINTVHMPSWCCESMIKPFVDYGLFVEFYPVYFDGKELITEYPKNFDVLFLMDYFGYSTLSKPSFSSGIVIHDITHSVFLNSSYEADYTFGSLRKWFGITTGGFAFKKNAWNTKLFVNSVDKNYVFERKGAMLRKEEYINRISDDKTYLSSFSKCEDFLDKCGIMSASKADIDTIPYIDVNYIKKSRRLNAQFIISELKEYVIFKDIKDNSCPLFVPIFVNNRDKLRKFLTDNCIYCPIHWPVSNYHNLNFKTSQIYNSEISLICDQRYNLCDMQKIVDFVKQGINLC